MSRALPNYLKTYRKRSGLSQEDVAFLVGLSSRAKVSRYEGGRRLPALQTLLAYEQVLGMPAQELFAGLNQQVERETRRRAKVLARRATGEDPTRTREHKLATLTAIAGTSSCGWESDLPKWETA